VPTPDGVEQNQLEAFLSIQSPIPLCLPPMIKQRTRASAPPAPPGEAGPVPPGAQPPRLAHYLP
jgi:hypothetical protein